MTDDRLPRHPARKSRIAAMGIGVAAMAGLVGNMEMAGRAHSAPAAPSPITPAETARRHAEAQDRAVAAALRLPVVLTPHAVVHTVVAPAAQSYGGSSGGYVYAAAPARAAAPVASTGGSHP